ncbi:MULTISPECIES: DUF2061 domain-containing protein [unclassified Caulobacter]|uniref:DUF2061 domain-containing protein n=1 Tax=unclassified Caulobacter TaxID=2648921 RepID=UPI0007803A30|nr:MULTISPECIES: DUF2061 domain-containing protein [unclassified Caulobacter]AZS23037.1 DUF2061 domain-containing protein [Caulobacter sp. FWC26]MCA0359267.1 DUF2061 domain-containing protein [Pseudomonadota bacterium]
MRLALKTLTYASMHLTVAVAVAYALTRDWRVALAVGLVEPMVQTVAFNIHERLWSRADQRARDRRDQALASNVPPELSPSAAA